ncbi:MULTISPECIES: N-6 DNA methylase [unclassified Treponema]|uniref:N-6 DNA methylase n=1 Tax=unclassified Treponema TaxID=2638727 RepID=UPI0025CCB89A|nr:MULTISPECIES: N-6 DNA methylase [unclassified Treponema]
MNNVKTAFFKKDIQNKFNISLATVNNWIKTGVIPSPKDGVYTKDDYSALIKSIETGSSRLQSRANRSYQNFSSAVFLGIKDKKRKELLLKLIEIFENSSLSIQEAVSCLGKQILLSNDLYDEKSDIFLKINNIYNGENIFENFHIENKDDDILGAFYQSVQTISCKSKDGAFYTPSEILSSIEIPINAKVLDPCCGSGSILINTLSKEHNPDKIFAFDIDEVALLICHINLVLFFNNPFISSHIEKHDLIFSDETDLFLQSDEKYDFIVTNPPWGSKLSKKQKDLLLSKYPFLNTTEIFSIALYNSINKLSANGKLNFFLPESILNVAAHKNIRKFLLNTHRNIEILPLGTAFKGVQSECVLLKLSEIAKYESQITVEKERQYKLNIKNITAPDYLISYNVSEIDDKILNKIYSLGEARLPESTKFALGVVTGNNKKFLHEERLYDDEPIFRGKDIIPYRLKSPEVFIKFTPDIFQQVAPVAIYRSKKIVYKFISDKIVCALDDGQLFLNSANMIISPDYPMEMLVCLFNSPVYTFIYQKKFKSKKVLKQHFQNFPLPVLDSDLSGKFYEVYADILNNTKTQKAADELICDYFGISETEYDYIKESVYGNP